MPGTGDWRDSFPVAFDWRVTFGESIVVGAPNTLQAWTDNVAGFQLVAPSVGQRPTQGALGWVSTVAGATQLWDIIGNAAWQATLGGTASYSFAVRANLTLVEAFGTPLGGSANGTNFTYLTERADGRVGMQRAPGALVESPVATVGVGAHVLAGSYHPVAGNNLHVYLDGVQVAIAAVGGVAMVVPAFAFLFARTFDGIATSAATQLELAEALVFNAYLTGPQQAAVSANLFADYP